MVNLTSEEIRRKYDAFARWYDLVVGVPDVLGVQRFRQSLLRRAAGNVLEVAVGTGKNVPYYPAGCRIVGIDISIEMLKVARQRAAKLAQQVSFALADTEVLPFPDKSFDTVASSLSTCTFPNPLHALREISRVCRPEGSILLLEHGRSDREWLGRWQDRRDDRHAKQLGCHWNRDTLGIVRDAGLRIVDSKRTFFGIFHQIRAEPVKT